MSSSAKENGKPTTPLRTLLIPWEGLRKRRQLKLERESILLQSFHEWAPVYSGPKFNLIHWTSRMEWGSMTPTSSKWVVTLDRTYDDSP